MMEEQADSPSRPQPASVCQGCWNPRSESAPQPGSTTPLTHGEHTEADNISGLVAISVTPEDTGPLSAALKNGQSKSARIPDRYMQHLETVAVTGLKHKICLIGFDTQTAPVREVNHLGLRRSSAFIQRTSQGLGL